MKSVAIGKRGFPRCFRRSRAGDRQCHAESRSRARLYREGRLRGRGRGLSGFADGDRAGAVQEQREAQIAQARKMEAMGVLADGIAHDFNNILSGIVGLAEIVMSRCLPPESPAQDYLADILFAGGRAKEFIAQLRCLTLSGRDRRNPCLLCPILDEVLALVEATLPDGVGLKREVNWRKAEILADAPQIQSLLLNILTNAVRSFGQRPGEIVVSLDRVALVQRPLPHPDLQEGTYARLAVSDTGDGIDAGILNRIFDPYFTTWKQKGGKGLGLSMAYGIARRHGGVVTVESEVGRGSLFTVYLPAASVGSGGIKRKDPG